ncbi:MAG: DUF378 domain-containing protein [Patescibacteria group bacterium]
MADVKMNGLDWVAFILVIVGGLNWGLVGATSGSFNLVKVLVGSWPMVESAVYILVGLAAVYMLVSAAMKK